MIKKDIIDRLHQDHGGMTLPEADAHTNTLLALLKQAMEEPEPVTITHFGKFHHKRRKVRDVIMPNGHELMSSAADRIQFLPCPSLKTIINAETGSKTEE